MKTLINITALAYDPAAPQNVLVPERQHSFIRPMSASTPTTTGAPRMVARKLGLRPSDVCVSRVEAMSYDVH